MYPLNKNGQDMFDSEMPKTQLTITFKRHLLSLILTPVKTGNIYDKNEDRLSFFINTSFIWG